jgi:TRAP-type C4-dicarboxylate transport system substrate-binding protein
VVLEAAAEAETRGWKLSADVTAEHLKIMADKGMTISAPDDKLRAELQRVGDTLTAEWLKKAGATGEQIISAYRKQ